MFDAATAFKITFASCERISLSSSSVVNALVTQAAKTELDFAFLAHVATAGSNLQSDVQLTKSLHFFTIALPMTNFGGSI